MVTTITREQYNALSDEEKPNWVSYHPVADPKIEAELDEAAAQAKAMAYIKPLHDKLAALPIENLPAEKLQEILNNFNPLMSAYKAIKSLLGLPIIGTLVSPLVDFINSLIQIIGGLFYLIFVLSRGQELFLDGIHNVIQQTDWEGLESAMKEVEKKKKEREAQAKADKEHNNSIKKKNAEKLKKAVDAATQKEMDEFEKRVEESYNKCVQLNAFAQIQQKLDQTLYVTLTWQGMKVLLVDFFSIIGLDLSPLDQVTPAQAKAFEKNFPSPANQIKEMNSMINKMNKNTVYIPLSEYEKIDKESADEIKKSRAERATELAESKAAYEERQKKAQERMDEIEKEEQERLEEQEELNKTRIEMYTASSKVTPNTIKTN